MLKQQLEKQLEQSEEASSEVMATTLGMINDLKANGIEKKALNEGETFPPFSLTNAKGSEVSSTELLSKGPLIITFYRGSWCPLCNLELRAYQAKMGEFAAFGANLIAITPEKPDQAIDSDTINTLDFEVLTDSDNQLARQCGLVFQIPDSMLEHYQTFGIDVAKSNGTGINELPIPATYLVRPDGVIAYAFVDADYLQRAEPDDVIKILKTL